MEKGGNHLTSDPNMVYATVAQIAATFVSILGGFLLTLGLARIAEKHRLELSFERQKRIVEEAKADDEREGKLYDKETEERENELLSIRLRALRGKLDIPGEIVEREHVMQKLREQGRNVPSDVKRRRTFSLMRD